MQRKGNGFFFEFSKNALPFQDEQRKIQFAPTLPIKLSNSFQTIDFDLINTKFNFSINLINEITSVSGFINEFTTNFLENYSYSYYRAVFIRESPYNISMFFARNNTLKTEESTNGSGVLQII